MTRQVRSLESQFEGLFILVQVISQNLLCCRAEKKWPKLLGTNASLSCNANEECQHYVMNQILF